MTPPRDPPCPRRAVAVLGCALALGTPSCAPPIARAPAPACAPEVFAEVGWGASSMAIDDTDVYWGQDTGELMVKAKRGGEARRLVWLRGEERRCLYRCWIAVDADSVYWVDGEGALRSVPKRGGEQVLLAPRGCSGVPVPDDDSVWCSGEDTVRRVPKRGGQAQVIAEFQAHLGDVAVDASFVYWSVNPEPFPDRTGCRNKANPRGPVCPAPPPIPCDVMRVAKAGGPVEVVLPGRCGRLVTLEGAVFLGAGLVSLADGGSRMASARAPLAGDGDEIYFLGWDVMRAVRAGGAPRFFAKRKHEDTTGLVVDRDNLYWLEQDRFGSYNDSAVKRASRACRR